MPAGYSALSFSISEVLHVGERWVRVSQGLPSMTSQRECLWLPSSGQVALHLGLQGEAFQGFSNEEIFLALNLLERVPG